MRGTHESKAVVYGNYEGKLYPIHDDYAKEFRQWWPGDNKLTQGFVKQVLSRQELWGISLDDLTGFTPAVYKSLHRILHHGVEAVFDGTQMSE